MMRTLGFLPLLTYPDASSEKLVINAIAVAKHLDLDIRAECIYVDIPDVSTALSGILLNVPQMIREAEYKSRAAGKKLLDALRIAAVEAGVSVTTDETNAPPSGIGEIAASQARYGDLSLMEWDAADSSTRLVAEEVLFGSGRPVVLLPSSMTVGVIDHVMIAWDGSRVAARALADAAPFLMRAKRISIATVLDEKPVDKKVGQRLELALQRRGLTAEVLALRVEGRAIGEALQAHALEFGAQLLVMGGFGHSRIRDFVLGGATADVLNDVRLPILLSH
ncbi:nucleotide-binding universal stress UspA family protein [Phyllobacterium trifolii]|uniref:Nucleotide-binding universal stress UspA family protein n=1 Tax=Phyllobacterium trifolii TaxID=300193 RepID=A0A839U7X2_9HYPH|nr:universal stress protein [Phyllobacterium trifolii]MBB3146858.1 nucleotide-binding universal stress UspA family protein [Phyllobacterium trifolii]